ncbi:MAG: TRAP transporter large permease subunit [Clostridiales Family XIII bacterium]|jgi:C4-dicarboxylate transporter DctM subunit|nr:TRAP transporter large permease subunit [Clostridiales Family XIII bacterium]
MLIETVIVFGMLCAMMIIGIPIAISLGLSGILTLVIFNDISSLQMLPQKLFSSCDSFALLAIPFFMVAGDLMLQGGISKRLVNMAKVFLWRIRGSLALIGFVSSAFFGALSGSAMATTAAIGKVMYPELLEDKTYDKDFALAIQAVGGTLGPMIPPSITLIVFGTLANASIGDMMIGTIVPGVFLCLIYCVTGYVLIRKNNMARSNIKPEKGVFKAFISGFWALLMPLIILGGIYTGVFSPTESAAAACLYAVIIGTLMYRELTFKKILIALKSSFMSYSAIMLLISCATFYGWVLTMEGIPQFITNALMVSVTDRIVLLLLINAIFLFLGCFVDVVTIILLVVPLLTPVVMHLGVDLVHFGVITNIVTGIGLITPPFGACLFVASGIDKSIKIESIYKRILPFCFSAVIGGLIVSFVPVLSLWFK